MINGISAIWLPVDDMQRAIAFYRDTLGLDVVDHDGDWSEVTAGDQRIGLNASESPAGDGGAVVAFAADDFDATVDELRERGVQFTGEVSEHPWGRIIPFADPDGNDLQIYAAPGE